MVDFSKLKEKYLIQIEEELTKTFHTLPFPEQKIVDSVKYSLLNGGKRTRGLFTLGFCKLFSKDITNAFPLVSAVEMIHCYSLIHDDLPCMDNDDFRRGQPSNHKQFGEATALLAGDALLTQAFHIIVKGKLPDDTKVKAIEMLASCAGYQGMIGGQAIDLDSENKEISLEQLERMHRLKTGAMFQASCVLGVLAAQGSEEEIYLAQQFSSKIGLAFQIIDDILDQTSTQEELGKPIGSDLEQNKSTFVTLLGLEQSKLYAQQLSQEAIDLLLQLPKSDEREFLITLTQSLLIRRN